MGPARPGAECLGGLFEEGDMMESTEEWLQNRIFNIRYLKSILNLIRNLCSVWISAGWGFTLGKQVSTFCIRNAILSSASSIAMLIFFRSLPFSLETWSSQVLFSARLLFLPSYFPSLPNRPSQVSGTSRATRALQQYMTRSNKRTRGRRGWAVSNKHNVG